jgi:uncharacterized protein YmfQ (DUF2313 family)
MAVTLAGWLASLQALLPPGRAIPRAATANFTKLLEAIASMLLAAQLRLEATVEQWDPRRATVMLTDWERLLGLPDACTVNQVLSTQERQRLAYQRLVEQGGQSRAYFLGIAAQLGEPDATITEFRQFTCNSDCDHSLCSLADTFTWRVSFNHPALNARWMNCNDDCTDGLQLYQPSLAECPLTERKPAHTTVIFAYTP